MAGHPLVGDRRYGALRACRYLEKNYNFNRLGLHAASLTLQTPDVETPLTFVSKGLPDKIEQLILDDATDGSMTPKRKRGG
jgi:23S rRNA-/tRNA-specific pseudouridylate synthase